MTPLNVFKVTFLLSSLRLISIFGAIWNCAENGINFSFFDFIQLSNTFL